MSKKNHRKVSGNPLYAKEKIRYRIRFEKALILSLILTILLFVLFRRIPKQRNREFLSKGYSFFSLDIVPATSQTGAPPPPVLPEVPIPTENEYLPEDETIEETKLNLTEGIPLFDTAGDRGEGINSGGIGLRPIKDVIPEYPKKERRKGIEGVVELKILVNSKGKVDSVVVLQNTTKSKILEKAAIQAAYKSLYLPAKKNGKKISIWIRRPYRFERR